MSRQGEKICHVLTAEEPVPTDERILRFSRFYGVRTRRLRVSPGNLAATLFSWAPGQLHLITSAATLHRILARDPDPELTARSLSEHVGSMLVFGLVPEAASDGVLRTLLGSEAVSCRDHASTDSQLEFLDDHSPATHPLHGASFPLPVTKPTPTGWLAGLTDLGGQPLILAGGQPFHVIFARAHGPHHFVAVREVVDLDEPTDRDFDLGDRIAGFAPFLIYLRQVFGESTYHSAADRAALIIDDPSLQPKHGCLRYDEILADMQKRDYTTTVAFIPMNTERTDAEVARTFREEPRHLSICVHGCFHTRHEFGDTDQEFTDRLSQTAIQRMRRHEQRTGVPFTPIMVFPHGVFAPQALGSLLRAGFMAAVNTHIHPRRGRNNRRTIADHLAVAVLSPDGVALYRRHSVLGPKTAFQIQALLGQPILMSAHHEFCRSDLSPLHQFLDGVHEALPRLAWDSLGEVIRRSFLQRRRADGRLECLVAANEAVVENLSEQPEEYLIVRREPPESPVLRVTLDDQEIEPRRRSGLLTMPLQLGPGAIARIRFIHHDEKAADLPENELSVPPSAVVRRQLCELWDNLVSHQTALLTPLTSLKERYSRGWPRE